MVDIVVADAHTAALQLIRCASSGLSESCIAACGPTLGRAVRSHVIGGCRAVPEGAARSVIDAPGRVGRTVVSPAVITDIGRRRRAQARIQEHQKPRGEMNASPNADPDVSLHTTTLPVHSFASPPADK